MAEKLSGETWAERFVLGVGQRVRSRRLELGLTVQQLATRVSAEVNFDTSAIIINNLEVGRIRYVDAALVTVLAAGLRCSPIALLYDTSVQAAPVEVLPGNHVRGWDAIGFASGSSFSLQWVLRDVLSRHDLRNLDSDKAVAQIELRRSFEEAAEHYGRTQSAYLAAARKMADGTDPRAEIELAIRAEDRSAAEEELRRLAVRLIEAGVDIASYRDGRPAPRDALIAWLITGKRPGDGIRDGIEQDLSDDS